MPDPVITTRKRLPTEVLALAGMVAVFFGPLLATGDVPVSRDLYFLYYPGYPLYRDMLRQGELPLWNPYCGCGEPFLADMQRAVLYPANLIYLIVGTGRATVLLSACHVFLAGLGAYALSRAWRVSRCGSLLAGVVFALNSFTITRYEFPAGLHATAWYPIVLLAFTHWLKTRKRSALLLTAGALCLQFLAGYPEASFFTAVSLIVYALLAGAAEWRTRRRWSALFAPLVGAALAGLLAVALSMAQLLPTWEASGLSYRAVVDPELNKASLHPLAIFSLLVPSIYGVPEHAGAYWAPSCAVYWLGAFYVGIPPLAVFLVALFFRWTSGSARPDSDGLADAAVRVRTPLLVTLLVVFFVYALGKYTPVFGLLWWVLPILHKFRWPPKCLMCVVLALACLSGIGLDRLTRAGRLDTQAPSAWRSRLLRWGPSCVFLLLGVLVAACLADGGRLAAATLVRWFNLRAVGPEDAAAIPWGVLLRDGIKLPVAGVVSVVLLYCYATRPHRRRVLGGLIVSVAFVDLLIANAFLLRSGPARIIDWPFTCLPLMRQDGTITRHDGGWQMLYGAYAVHSSHNFWPGNTARVVGLLSAPDLPVQNKLRLLRVLNCERIVHLQDVNGLLTGRDVPPPTVRHLEPPLPRAYVVGGPTVVGDWSAVIGALGFGDIDPLATALTDEPAARTGALDDLRPSRVGHTTKIVSYQPNHVRIDVHAESSGLLVLSDTHYPGWLATVNGRETPIYRVNGAFRGVRVPAGDSVVEMVYRPQSFRVGAIISGATLVLMLLLAIPARRSVGRANGSASEHA